MSWVGRLALAWLAVPALTGNARAAPAPEATEVVLLQPEPGDALLAETLVRLRGELGAVGFEVVMGPGPDHDPRWELEEASTAKTGVTITLRRAADGIDVWILDRLSGKTSIRRITGTLTVHDAPTVLAVRTTDLLRASLLELTLEAPPAEPPRPPLPRAVARWMEPPPASLFAGWTVDAGVSALGSQGLGFAALPSLRISHGVGGPLAARLTVGTTVPQTTLDAPLGQAALEQQILLGELVLPLRKYGVVIPLVSAGAGTLRLGTDGKSYSAAYVGNSSSDWLFLADVGIGVAFRVSRMLSLLVDGQAALTAPRERVFVADVDLGLVGQPSFLFGGHVLLSL